MACTNPEAATGGRDGETVEEIRINSLANFPTQLRAVTKDDYMVRAYSMPSRFGSVSKAYIVQDDQITTEGNRIPNPFALNMYVLGYNADKKLAALNQAVKENLKVYLGFYRMLTDAINIKAGYIVNIGVKFEIIAFKNYNKKEVILNCIDRLKEFFNIDDWQFNQPIILADIQTELFKVEGVQAVVAVAIDNKYGSVSGYSDNIYDIKAATKDNIIYPSVDPCIFECKFPNSDIEGRAL